MGSTDQPREPEPSGTAATGETLRTGPPGLSSWQRLPDRWRRAAVVLLALVLGAAVGAVATRTTQEDPARAPGVPVRAHEHDVELVLFGAVRPGRAGHGGASRPLRLRAAVLLSGNQPSEVLAIDSLDGSLVVRASGLPVTVSTGDRFHALTLAVVPRDCAAARRWPPDSRPFAVTWRDEGGLEHTDRGGDHSASTARAVRRHLEAACR